MPEWNKIVRENLPLACIIPQQQEQVAEELAGHLEDLYDEFRLDGYCEADALRLTMQEVGKNSHEKFTTSNVRRVQ
jgi:hypothetical protein